MKHILFIIYFALAQYGAFAQTTIESINHKLDTQPYFDIGLDYNTNIVLPDSVKTKMLKALNRELPKHFADSVFTLQESVLENVTKEAWKKCKTDTICFEKEYEDMSNKTIASRKNSYSNRCLSSNLVLACGSWGIKEAIPYLEKELQNQRCIEFKARQIKIEMALAKLNDSIKQVLIDRYTLSNVVENSLFDTINNNTPYDVNYPWSYYYGIQTAIYLKNQEMILNIVDLMYIRGVDMWSIGNYYYYVPAVSGFLQGFQNCGYFRIFPNREALHKICSDYRNALGKYKDKTPTKEELKRIEHLLSTEYVTKIRNQIREWVIENVNFEE